MRDAGSCSSGETPAFARQIMICYISNVSSTFFVNYKKKTASPKTAILNALPLDVPLCKLRKRRFLHFSLP